MASSPIAEPAGCASGSAARIAGSPSSAWSATAGGCFSPFLLGALGRRPQGGGGLLFGTVKNTGGLVLEIPAGSPEVTIDFNFAYNPSCAYDARWACPLAPRENWLPVPVRAGEKVFA